MKVNNYGWMGKLLRVDLTKRKTWVQPTSDYVPEWIGGRGIGAKIAWDEIKPGTGPFSPENILMILTGPLSGTAAPFSGRTTVCSLAPQGWPHEWFTHSSFGGHWGPELKYAGYDGIIINGCSDKPVYLRICDDKVEIRDARDLWGLGIYETQQRLIGEFGQGWRVFAIGQAGENLSRISIIATETESASGQGGFGAVMGFKRLKAIAVRGTNPVCVAKPEEFLEFSKAVADEAHGSHGWPRYRPLDTERVQKYGERYHACTQQCTARCWDARYYTKVPGVLYKQTYAGQVDCVAQLFPGLKCTFYDWGLGFEAGFEIGRMTNDYGLNHWEILIGMMPWLRDCHREGLIKDIDGLEIDFDDPRFWAELMRKMAFREGMGDALSQGGVRASEILGLGQEIVKRYYLAWGYAGHWDGHGDKINYIFFPYWLVSALQWAFDTRDPISSAHGYGQNIMGWSKVCSPKEGLSWERIAEIGERVYGSPLATHPESGYADKAYPAVWHGHRSVLKDSLTLDDQIFPRIFSKKTEDNFARIGSIEGPSFEHRLYVLATGDEIGEDEFYRRCERVINIERCLLSRNFGRSRKDDETVIPYFETLETRVNPLIGEPVAMDGDAFRQVMDEYYRLRGWDTITGLPTEEKLRDLDLPEAADLMKAKSAE